MFGIQGGRRDEAYKLAEHHCFDHIIGHAEQQRAVQLLRGHAGFVERDERP